MDRLQLLYLDHTLDSSLAAVCIGAYVDSGFAVTLNTHLWLPESRRTIAERFTVVDIDPADSTALIQAIQVAGFDGIVLPASHPGPPEHFWKQLRHSGSFKEVRVVGCPNDSLSHLSDKGLAARISGWEVLSTVGIHAHAVSEYTIGQFVRCLRKLDAFSTATGVDGAWPHDRAVRETRLLNGKMLAVLGGSGRDGSAVISLAKAFVGKIKAMGSGSELGNEQLRRLGVQVCNSLEELFDGADLVSINCRAGKSTTGIIRTQHLHRLNPGSIIVNPSAAEILDADSVLEEFRQPPASRTVGTLILDMAFGHERGPAAFLASDLNEKLKQLGVTFTPRMAGYTSESRLAADTQLAHKMAERFAIISPAIDCPRSACTDSLTGEGQESKLLADSLEAIIYVGRELLSPRFENSTVFYKSDGSPATGADAWAESELAVRLRAAGHVFNFMGEESQSASSISSSLDIIVDGIDGTRNFRDGNFGWCVSMAAIRDGSTLFGIVFDPLCDDLFVASRWSEATHRRRGRDLPLCIPPQIPSDFSFSIGSFRIQGSSVVKEQIASEIKKLGGRGREWGSVALSICAVARGGLGSFIQSGSFRHDHAAAIFIAEKAGASVFHRPLDSPVNSEDIIVSHPSIHTQVMASFLKQVENLPARHN